jgi:uncharacterized membrane protein
MDTRTVIRSFAIGATCGLRSMTGPAVVRWRAQDPIRLALAALAVGELIADKLPAAPPRTIPPALVFRALAGAFSGRSVAVALDGDQTQGTLAGALGAIVGAYAGLALRTGIVRASRLPDPFVALFEDGLALATALAASAN